MTQTALNEQMTITADEWTLISEVNCTFMVEQGAVQIIGMQDAAPAADAAGIAYRRGQGEEASTDTLARFTGAGTANRIYAKAMFRTARLFVSRAAVA